MGVRMGGVLALRKTDPGSLGCCALKILSHNEACNRSRRVEAVVTIRTL